MPGTRIDKQYNQDVHLSNYALGEWNKKEQYVASQILPRVAVETESGYVSNNGRQGMRLVNTTKAEKGEYSSVNFKIEAAKKYDIQYHGLIDDITVREKQNWMRRGLLPLQELKTKNLMGLMMNAFEKAILVDILSDNTVMTNNETLIGSDKWSDPTSNPLEVIRDKIDVIFKATGQEVKKIVMPRDVLTTLADHPDVKAKLGDTSGRAQVMNKKRVIQILEDEFDVTIIEPLARYYDTSDNPQYFFDNKVALLAVSDNPTIDTLDFGKTFSLVGDMRPGMIGGGVGPIVGTFDYANTTEGFKRDLHQGIKVIDNYDPVIQEVDCSFLLEGVLS